MSQYGEPYGGSYGDASVATSDSSQYGEEQYGSVEYGEVESVTEATATPMSAAFSPDVGTRATGPVTATAQTTAFAFTPDAAQPRSATAGTASPAAMTFAPDIAHSLGTATGEVATTAFAFTPDTATSAIVTATATPTAFTFHPDVAVQEVVVTGTASPVGFSFTGDTAEQILRAWTLDGAYLGELIGERRTWQAMELTLRADLETLEQATRDLRSHTEQYEVVPVSDGSYYVEDTAGTQNTYSIEAPTGRDDVRYKTTWHADSYEEKAIDQVGDRYQVKTTLVATDNKTPQATYDGGAAGVGKQWVFEFAEGDVATTRVKHDMAGTGQKGTDGRSLTVSLTPLQVRTLEESVRKLEAVSVTEVPDGQNLVQDNSPEEVNTVNVVPPPGYAMQFDGLSSGQYVEFPDDASLDITGDITIAFTIQLETVNVTGSNDYRTIISKGEDVGDAYSVIMEEDGSVAWSVHKNGSRQNARGGTVPDDGSTATVVVRHDTSEGNSDIWVNGSQVELDTSLTAGATDSTASPVYLSTPDDAHQPHAVVDRVYVSSRIWSTDEIDDYDSGESIDYGDLRLGLDFHGGQGTDVLDSSPHDNTGTATGTPSWVRSPFRDTDAFDAFTPGEYVVSEWETQWLNDAFYEVNLDLLQK